jgi:anti-sigma regulatory factor (Ser/Thr protein kinase)
VTPWDLNLRLAGGYYFDTLKRMIVDLGPILALEEPATIQLDLTDLTFVGPAALALMTAALARVQEQGLLKPGCAIVFPRSAGLARYLERIGFHRIVLMRGAGPGSPQAAETVGFRECIRFSKDSECRAVAKTLSDSLAESGVVTDVITQRSLDVCLTELAENVYFHADCPQGGFAAAQHLRKSREVELAIVDLGIGIRRSLLKNADYAAAARNDLDAIEAAMTVTITATPERNSGYGLAFTNLLMGLNDGRMMIRSGAGHVQRGAKVFGKLESYELPGTLVAMRLRTDRPFDSRRAWELLTEAIVNLTGRSPDDDDDDDQTG